MDENIVMRRWSARIRTEDSGEYVAYVKATGLDGYRTTPGNLGYQLLVRDIGDGSSEVSTLSWWRSMEAIRAFAGDSPELARYYPEDDKFLIEKPEHVEHHRVASNGLCFAPARGGLVGH